MIHKINNKVLEEKENLELSGKIKISGCLSAENGGNICFRDASILVEEAFISSSVFEHNPGKLIMSDCRFSGTLDHNEALISGGTGSVRMRNSSFRNLTGCLISMPFLGAYSCPPRMSVRKTVDAVLKAGESIDGIDERFHFIADSCSFVNCHATDEPALAVVTLNTDDEMEQPALLLFRNCTFNKCSGERGIVYVQDIFGDQAVRIIFDECKFISCRKSGTGKSEPIEPRIILHNCSFDDCTPDDCFYTETLGDLYTDEL